jgi:hypothetical protein
MAEPNRRSLADALSTVSKALPAAAANNTSDPIYIGGNGPHREGMKLRVSWPANTVLVATKTLTLTLYSSQLSVPHRVLEESRYFPHHFVYLLVVPVPVVKYHNVELLVFR